MHCGVGVPNVLKLWLVGRDPCKKTVVRLSMGVIPVKKQLLLHKMPSYDSHILWKSYDSYKVEVI